MLTFTELLKDCEAGIVLGVDVFDCLCGGYFLESDFCCCLPSHCCTCILLSSTPNACKTICFITTRHSANFQVSSVPLEGLNLPNINVVKEYA